MISPDQNFLHPSSKSSYIFSYFFYFKYFQGIAGCALLDIALALLPGSPIFYTGPLLRFSLTNAATLANRRPAGRGLPGFQGPLVFLPEVVFLQAVVVEVPGE